MARKPATVGRPPKPPCRLVAHTTIAERDWELWEIVSYDAKWRNFKLIALERKRGKANYWFGWHVIEKRLAINHDSQLLVTERPKVHHLLIDDVFSKPPNPARSLRKGK